MKTPTSDSGPAVVAIVALVIILAIVAITKDANFKSHGSVLLIVALIVSLLVALFKGPTTIKALQKLFWGDE